MVASKKLFNKQIEALDFQINQLYESFTRAVRTTDYQDAVWNKLLFLSFGESLGVATDYSAFMNWSKNNKRNSILDKYLLYHAVGFISSTLLENRLRTTIRGRMSGHAVADIETDVTVDTLKEAIEGTKLSYSKIESMAIALAKAANFAGLINVLDYVNKKYEVSVIFEYDERI